MSILTESNTIMEQINNIVNDVDYGEEFPDVFNACEEEDIQNQYDYNADIEDEYDAMYGRSPFCTSYR